MTRSHQTDDGRSVRTSAIPKPVWLLLGVAALALLLEVAHTITPIGPAWLFDDVIYNGLGLLAVGLVLARAATRREDRVAWIVLGVGMLAWVADLTRDGWRPTTGAKDPERRLHPLLVGWDELSEPDRDLDREPVREIPAMLARAGFRIVRAHADGPDLTAHSR